MRIICIGKAIYRRRNTAEMGRALVGKPILSAGLRVLPLECGLQAGIKGARARRAERPRIGERRAAIEKIRQHAGIEERSVRRIAIIEEIIDTAIELIRLVDLVGSVNVEHRIRWQFRRLVGGISDQKLTAYIQNVTANLESVADRVIEPRLDAMTRDRRNLITRQHLNIAIDVGKRTVRGELQCVKKACINECVTRVSLPLR